MIKNSKKGVFIVVDGTDGSGKGTQVRRLKEILEDQDQKIEIVDFPQYGKISAAVVTAYLNGEFGHNPKNVKPEIASIFFAIDRWSAKPVIEKGLSEGKIVIANRYVSSNKGHQAGKISDQEKLDQFLYWVDDLEYNIFDLPRPDKIFFLHVPPAIGQKLVDEKDVAHRKYAKGKKRDIHEGDLHHLEDAEKAYLYVAKKEKWHIVECIDQKRNLRSVEDINNELLKEIKKLL